MEWKEAKVRKKTSSWAGKKETENSWSRTRLFFFFSPTWCDGLAVVAGISQSLLYIWIFLILNRGEKREGAAAAAVVPNHQSIQFSDTHQLFVWLWPPLLLRRVYTTSKNGLDMENVASRFSIPITVIKLDEQSSESGQLNEDMAAQQLVSNQVTKV